MPLPVFFHIGNAGGNAFVGALGGFAKRPDILSIHQRKEFEALRPKLTPDYVARLTLALGHGIHYADSVITNRYDIAMLRWPRAHFSAQVTYYNENPQHSRLGAMFSAPDPYDRLRTYLTYLEQDGEPDYRMSAFDWLNERHGLGCEERPKRRERVARVDDFDAVLRDRYALVGICELMDETLFLFQADFPDWQILPWLRNAVNKKRVNAFTMPTDIVERMEHELTGDTELYNRARRRLLDRFVAFWKARPDLHDRYLIYKTAMILTDPLLMTRFAEGDPLYFPPELPLDELRNRVTMLLPRAEEIRTRITGTYG